MMGPMSTLRYGTPQARWVLATTALGSGMAFLDGTVVNVALPSIGRDLNAEVSGLQWIINGYMLMLAALILLSGSLGDRLGRRGQVDLGQELLAGRLLRGEAGHMLAQQLGVVGRPVEGLDGEVLGDGVTQIAVDPGLQQTRHLGEAKLIREDDDPDALVVGADAAQVVEVALLTAIQVRHHQIGRDAAVEPRLQGSEITGLPGDRKLRGVEQAAQAL